MIILQKSVCQGFGLAILSGFPLQPLNLPNQKWKYLVDNLLNFAVSCSGGGELPPPLRVYDFDLISYVFNFSRESRK